MYGLLPQSSRIWWQWVVEASWQSALVGVGLLLVVVIAKRWPSPLRYALLLIALLKFVVPPLWSSPTGAFSRMTPVAEVAAIAESVSLPEVPERNPVVWSRFKVSAADSSTDALSLSPEQNQEVSQQQTSRSADASPSTILRPHVPGSDERTAFNGAGSSVAESVRSSPETLPAVREWKVWLMLLHLAGTATVAALVLRRLWQLRRLVANAYIVDDERIQTVANQLHQQLRVRRRVRLLTSGDVESPIAFGTFRPTIVLPEKIGELDHADLTSVVAHELIHLKRGDAWSNWLQLGVFAVWWFHPVVWALQRAVRRVREDCCDDALLAAGISTESAYCETLLRVAAQPAPAFPAGLTFGMADQLHPIADRMKRIMDPRLKRTVRLSFAGTLAVLLLCCVLLPGVGNGASVGGDPADGVQTPEAKQQASDEKADLVQPVDQPVLSGRIIDDTGVPVTDAELMLQGPEYLTTNTDEDGNYSFDSVKKKGEYRLRIKSVGWIGMTNRDELPGIDLSPDSQVRRDFTLARAALVEIRAVDEDDNPIKGVQINTASLGDVKYRNIESVSTDADGRAVIGGLKPSDVKYILGLRHDDYGIEQLMDLVEDVDTQQAHTVTMRKGVTVKGKAVCSDGKPPAGWRILAMPTWWHYGVTPTGKEISEDGSFELKHILPGKYDITISVPSGEGASSPKTVINDVELLGLDQPLALKMDHPSPASLTYISGEVLFIGKRPERGMWLHARSEVGNYSTGVFLRGDETKFRLGPIPPGLYRIDASHPELEPTRLDKIKAPTDDLKIELVSRRKPTLQGRVLLSDDNTPATEFRVRIAKLRTLSGPHYVQDDDWKSVTAADGRFSFEVNSPGVYQVTADAEGFAPSVSEPVNTVDDPDKSVDFVLNKGVTVSGTVVDEDGRPVSGAKVTPLSLASGGMPRTRTRFVSEAGAVQTKDGDFTLHNLPRRKESFRVTHPDYCFAVVDDVDLSSPVTSPLQITLTRGGTIRGLVFDGNGKRAANVTLRFQDENGYGGSGDELVGRFATTVTDSKGFYQVKHLPQQLVHIHRDEEWQSLGVVRRAVLPQNGATHTVHFGGPSPLSGRLLVNGEPVANNRVQLGGESGTFGIMKAYTRTDADGRFAFYGPPPGLWTLYYQPSRADGQIGEWIPVRPIEVSADEPVDLGDIEHLAGVLTIDCRPSDTEILSNLRFSLHEYDPIWPHGRSVGTQRVRQSNSDPFVFEYVPPGDFELMCYWNGHDETRRRLKLTAENLTQTVDFPLPTGTASLSGNLDQDVCGPGGCPSLKLWSEDGRRLTYIVPNDEQTYRVDHLPAGTWLLREKDTRNAPVLQTIDIQAGEQKTLNLTRQNTSVSNEPTGFVTIRTYLPDGILTSCRVELQGSNGLVPTQSVQNGITAFVAPPGHYEATVTLAGFQPVQKEVILKPTTSDGRAAAGSQIDIHLENRLRD